LKVLILSNMWPDKYKPYKGGFVYRQYYALDALPDLQLNRIVLINNVNKYLAYFLFYLEQFLRIRDFYRADVILVHQYTHSCWFIAFLPGLKAKILVHFHGYDLLIRSRLLKFFAPLHIRFLQRVDGYIFPSKYFRKLGNSLYKFMSSKRSFISYSGGVGSRFYLSHDLDLQKKRTYTFGFVGRLEPEKGYREFLDFARSCLIYTDFSFVLYGYGDGLTECMDKALDLPNLTILTPDNLNVEQVYRKISNLLFLSKHKESLGLVPLEAIASGCRVFSYPQKSLKELVLDPDSLKFIDSIKELNLDIIKLVDVSANASSRSHSVDWLRDEIQGCRFQKWLKDF